MAPVTVARAELLLTEQGLIERDSAKVFTGKAVEYFEDGQMKVSLSIDSGAVHGLTQAWHENGVLESSEFFKSGVSEGLRTRWYDDGTKRSEAMIVTGELHGEYKKWHRNGQLAQQAIMRHGVADGESQSWYEDGTLKATVLLKNGEVLESNYYDPSGNIKK